jgi:hypothetical protein
MRKMMNYSCFSGFCSFLAVGYLLLAIGSTDDRQEIMLLLLYEAEKSVVSVLSV